MSTTTERTPDGVRLLDSGDFYRPHQCPKCLIVFSCVEWWDSKNNKRVVNEDDNGRDKVGYVLQQDAMASFCPGCGAKVIE